MLRKIVGALAVVCLPLAAQAAASPFIIGAASRGPGSFFLTVPVTVACPKGELIQVVAVEVGDRGSKISAVDSGGVNIYQAGGGKWKGPGVVGSFLATTSPREFTNAGLAAGATITVTYSRNNAWQGAIAECVPGVEKRSGSADNSAGSSPASGLGEIVRLKPSSALLAKNEPLFVAVVVVGGGNDNSSISLGYRRLFELRGQHKIILDYQAVNGFQPTPYLATNSAARVWSASNRSYKTSPPPGR